MFFSIFCQIAVQFGVYRFAVSCFEVSFAKFLLFSSDFCQIFVQSGTYRVFFNFSMFSNVFCQIIVQFGVYLFTVSTVEIVTVFLVRFSLDCWWILVQSGVFLDSGHSIFPVFQWIFGWAKVTLRLSSVSLVLWLGDVRWKFCHRWWKWGQRMIVSFLSCFLFHQHYKLSRVVPSSWPRSVVRNFGQ